MEPAGHSARQRQLELQMVRDLEAMRDALVQLSLALHDFQFETSVNNLEGFDELAWSLLDRCRARVDKS